MNMNNVFKKSAVFSLFILFLNALNAQVDYTDFIVSGELGSYYKVAVKERIAVPYVSSREADMKYTKRVIRCIDVRQKMNKCINWPKSALNEHLMTALWEGTITPYRSDSLLTPMTSVDFQSRLSYEIQIFISTDPEDPTIGYDTIIQGVMEASSIQKFWLLEEWNFDYKLGVFKPRIIGMAPVYQRQFSFGLAPEQPLCWIKMDQQTRDVLDRWELFNRYNDAARLSFDDLFQMRLFDSYIVFENNVFDLMINQFEEFEDDQVGALVKADEVKNDLFIFEHDLWQF
ncbi:MAG: gliding motility protein GldN [Bacteroidia bacterium]|nr:gliding motility protein GldN [Bacteroidia bacterium]